MKILVVSQYYYPEQFRINDICAELVKKGHQVTVLTGRPNYPKGEIFPGYENDKQEEIINGVRVIRCKCRPRHQGIFNLAMNYLSFVYQGCKSICKLENNYDLVFVYGISPITMAVPAIFYKLFNKVPVYYYCLDIWPEAVREISSDKILSKYHPVYLIVKVISRIIYYFVDCIGVKCNQFSDYLEETCGVEKDKIVLLYEHAEDNYLEVNEIPKDNGCYDFMFLGNIGSSQNCEIIIKAFKMINSEKNRKLHFVGDGSDLEHLKNLVDKLEMNNAVIFHGRKPIEEINEYYNLADCCILTLSNRTACGLTPPAKLTGYMAACRPVIAAAEGATKDIVKNSECGICVGHEDLNALTDAMEYMLEHQKVSHGMGLRGRAYFKKNFLLDIFINKLLSQFKEIKKN